jgi:hypothetical protein
MRERPAQWRQRNGSITAEASLNYISDEAENRIGTGYDEDNPMQSFVWFGRQVDIGALQNYRCSADNPTPYTPGGQFNWNYNYHNNPYWEQLVNTNADDGGFSEGNIYRSETNADVLVTATRQLSSQVSMDITAGGNVRNNTYETSGVNVTALTAPDIYTIDNASVTPNPNDYMERKRVRSLYGSLSLNHGGFLNLDVTGRNDWSSTLPSGNNSYFYPSVSTAFVFTDALGVQSDFLSSMAAHAERSIPVSRSSSQSPRTTCDAKYPIPAPIAAPPRALSNRPGNVAATGTAALSFESLASRLARLSAAGRV